MNSTNQVVINIIFGLALWLFIVYVVYRRNSRNLNDLRHSQKVKPSKIRFVFSWLTYALVFFIPSILIIGFMHRELALTLVGVMAIWFLSAAPAVYPYYSIALFKSKINGATQWSWRWNRVEIAVKDIDVNKTLHQPVGKAFGIMTIYSTHGQKILTLGLSGSQLAQLLKVREKQQTSEHAAISGKDIP